MRQVLQGIADGFRERPLSPAKALRSGLRWLVPMAAVQLFLGLFALLGEDGLFAAGLSVAAMQPLSALMIFLAGLQINRGLKPHGALVMACAGLYVFAGLVPLLVGAADFWVYSFFAAAFLGPIVGLVLFGLLAGALWVTAPPDRPAHIAWAVGLAFPGALLLSLPTLASNSEYPMLAAWVLAPQVATALACFLAHQHLRVSRAELDLVGALMRPELQGFELLEHTSPPSVVARLSLPSMPFERAKGRGTPLGNPVLDELLPLQTQDPRALAEALSGHEATVLAVLHAWPLTRLHNDTLSWEATMGQIQAKGPDMAQTLAQARADLRSFQALFETLEAHTPAPSKGSD